MAGKDLSDMSITELKAEFDRRQAEDEVKNLDAAEVKETLEMNGHLRDILTTEDPAVRDEKLGDIAEKFYNRFTNEGAGITDADDAYKFVGIMETMFEGDWEHMLNDENLSPAEMIGIWADISHTMAGAGGITLNPDGHPLAKAIAERAMDRAGVAADNEHILGGFTRNIQLALDEIRDDVKALKILGETPPDTPTFDHALPVETLNLELAAATR